jgi:hypothetical protein
MDKKLTVLCPELDGVMGSFLGEPSVGQKKGATSCWMAQSARLSPHPSEMAPPPFHPQASVAPHPDYKGRGIRSLAGKVAGESQFGRRDRHSGTLGIVLYRGGHRHLQIGRMHDIDLISEPPHAHSPQIYVPKVWESVWPVG